jgi:hypothetical protein
MKNLMINWGLLLNYLINYWKARIMLYDVIWSGYGSTLVDTKIGGIWMFIPQNISTFWFWMVLARPQSYPYISWLGNCFKEKNQQCRKLSTKASTSEWTLTLCTETLGTYLNPLGSFGRFTHLIAFNLDIWIHMNTHPQPSCSVCFGILDILLDATGSLHVLVPSAKNVGASPS